MSDKEKLLNLIKDSKQTDEQIFKMAGELTRESQHGIDLANATEPYVKALPVDRDFSSGIHAWENRHKAQLLILEKMNDISTMSFTASGSTVSSTIYTYVEDPLQAMWNVDPSVKPDIVERAKVLKRVVERDMDKNKLIKIINEFELNVASQQDQKTPIESLETAWEVFEKPATQEPSPETYLIPMRACINSVIGLLIKRRQQQEPAKSNKSKISSICKQLALDTLTEPVVNDLADRFDELIDDLSGAKDGKYSREKGRALLNRSILFLQELLLNLDKRKMKIRG